MNMVSTNEYSLISKLKQNGSNVEVRYGKLAMEICGLKLPLQVLHSPAGYYIGTMGEPDGYEEHISRESEYWQTRGEAEQALATECWTQRLHPWGASLRYSQGVSLDVILTI